MTKKQKSYITKLLKVVPPGHRVSDATVAYFHNHGRRTWSILKESGLIVEERIHGFFRYVITDDPVILARWRLRNRHD